MFQNTKLLILTSFFIIFSGLGFLWFGSRSEPQLAASPSSSPVIQNSPEATGSARPLTPASPPAKPGEAAEERSDGEQATQGLMGEKTKVIKVVDGDTIQIENGQTVRLIGIDTPETVDPRRPVGCFGKEASNEVKSLLSGKEIIMQKDVSETDKYKRLLRYIFLPIDSKQTLFVNDYLVRSGFAKASTYPPDVKYSEQFRQAQEQAREGKKGLWGRC